MTVAVGQIYEEKRADGKKTMYLVVGETKARWRVAVLLNPPPGHKVGEVLPASTLWFFTSYVTRVA